MEKGQRKKSLASMCPAGKRPKKKKKKRGKGKRKKIASMSPSGCHTNAF
jgi:hypothetical protein